MSGWALPRSGGAPLTWPLGRRLAAAQRWLIGIWLGRVAHPIRPLLHASRREKALERVLDELTDRLARSELAMLREARRAEAAETALVRLQNTLDGLRRRHSA